WSCTYAPARRRRSGGVRDAAMYFPREAGDYEAVRSRGSAGWRFVHRTGGDLGVQRDVTNTARMVGKCGLVRANPFAANGEGAPCREIRGRHAWIPRGWRFSRMCFTPLPK